MLIILRSLSHKELGIPWRALYNSFFNIYVFFFGGKKEPYRSRRTHVSFWKDKDKGFDFLGFSLCDSCS